MLIIVQPLDCFILAKPFDSTATDIIFSWMNPLMQLGYKRPLTEKDIWRLDTWDQTETLNNKSVPYFLRFISNFLN